MQKFCLPTALLIISCTTIHPTKVQEVDSEKGALAVQVPLTSLANDLTDWAAAWQEFIPGFEPSQMQKIQSGPITPDISDPLELHENILDLQEEFPYSILFPSPNFMKVVFVSPSGSPDSAVAILSPEENLYERVLFCGTPCAFDGAVWIDDEKFVVTGYYEIHPDQMNGCMGDELCTVVPTLHVFDLNKNSVTEYYGPEVESDVFFGA